MRKHQHSSKLPDQHYSELLPGQHHGETYVFSNDVTVTAAHDTAAAELNVGRGFGSSIC